MRKASHIFLTINNGVFQILTFEILKKMLTDDVVSFEQPGPDLFGNKIYSSTCRTDGISFYHELCKLVSPHSRFHSPDKLYAGNQPMHNHPDYRNRKPSESMWYLVVLTPIQKQVLTVAHSLQEWKR